MNAPIAVSAEPCHNPDLHRAVLEFESGKDRLLRAYRSHEKRADFWCCVLDEIANAEVAEGQTAEELLDFIKRLARSAL